MKGEIKKTAALSRCGQYRYMLTRIWDDERPPMIFMMLNPSTADAEKDDPTIRRCMGFAEREGRGGIAVVNLYPLRTPNPDVLFSKLNLIDEFAWKKNKDVIISILRESHDGAVVCGWGASGQNYFLHQAVRDLTIRLIELNGATYCLGTDNNGNPRHPLYLKKDAALVHWTPR